MRLWRGCLYSVVLLILAGALNAQTKRPDYEMKYESGQKVYVFGNFARVRKKPSVRGKIICQLFSGDKVEIVGDAKTSLIQDGYRENWIEIKFQYKNRWRRGYIWGALLSKTSLELAGKDGKDKAILLFGVLRQNDGIMYGEARVLRMNKVVSKVEFEIHTNPLSEVSRLGYNVYSELFIDKGFKPDCSIIKIGFYYEACDAVSGDVILTWDGVDLRYSLLTESTGNEVYSKQYRYIFPNDEEGQVNRLIVVYNEETRNEDDPLITESQKSTFQRYKWSIGRLMLEKEGVWEGKKYKE